jgi:hypothetical protein
MPRLAVGPTHLPVQWVLGPGYYVKQSPPSSSEVKNENFTFLQYNLPAQQFVISGILFMVRWSLR